jgi:hypothetical protein
MMRVSRCCCCVVAPTLPLLLPLPPPPRALTKNCARHSLAKQRHQQVSPLPLRSLSHHNRFSVLPASSPGEDSIPRLAMRCLQASLVKNEQNRSPPPSPSHRTSFSLQSHPSPDNALLVLASRPSSACCSTASRDSSRWLPPQAQRVCGARLTRVCAGPGGRLHSRTRVHVRSHPAVANTHAPQPPPPPPSSFDDDTREDFANASEHAALLAEAGVLQKLVALLHGNLASAEAAATIAKLLVRNEYCKKVLNYCWYACLHRGSCMTLFSFSCWI